jgi:chromosome segregation ATPase
MTENQTKEMFNLLTRCVNGIQELKEDASGLKDDVSEVKSDISALKADVSELKAGQNRIEKQIRLNNAVINEIAGEQLRINSRVTELEKTAV